MYYSNDLAGVLLQFRSEYLIRIKRNNNMFDFLGKISFIELMPKLNLTSEAKIFRLFFFIFVRWVNTHTKHRLVWPNKLTNVLRGNSHHFV